MTRKELAEALAARMAHRNLKPHVALEAVNHIVDIMTATLQKGEPVYFRGFATIEVKKRKAHNVFNFATKTTYTLPPRLTVTISASKRLDHIINDGKEDTL